MNRVLAARRPFTAWLFNVLCLGIFSGGLMPVPSALGQSVNLEPEAAPWIWHPEVDPLAPNRWVYFRKTVNLAGGGNPGAVMYYAADSNARLWVNGEPVRRKVTRYHNRHIRPERVPLGPWLKPGANTFVFLVHSWGPIKNFQRQAERRAGLWVYSDALPELSSGRGWECAEAPEFLPHGTQIMGVIGDARIRFPVVMDGSLHDPAVKTGGGGLNWRPAEPVADGPWRVIDDYFPKAQREYFFPVQRLLAAGTIAYPTDFSANPAALKTGVDFPGHMERAAYKPDAFKTRAWEQLLLNRAAVIRGNPGETHYLTFDFHQPVHGYPSFRCRTETAGAALSFGYGELNVSHLDGTLQIDPVTGKIQTQGVTGTHYGDRYLTAGTGDWEIIEIPEERTARYMTLHVTFPAGGAGGEVELASVGMVKSQYPIVEEGSFECGDPRIDQIVALSKIHAEITMSDTYVDTPGREDGQWLEDIRLRALLSQTWYGDAELRLLTLLHSDECRVDGKFLSFAPQCFAPITGFDWGMQWITMLYDHTNWFSPDDPTRPYPGLTEKLIPTLIEFTNIMLDNVDERGWFLSTPVFADIRVGRHPRGRQDASVIVHAWLIERLRQAIDILELSPNAARHGETIQAWNAKLGSLIEAFRRDMVIRDDEPFPYAADVVYGDDGRKLGKSQAAQISAILAGLFTESESRAILDAFFAEPAGPAPEGIAPWNNPTYFYRALRVLSDHGFEDRAMALLRWRMNPYLPCAPRNIAPPVLQGPLGGPLPEYFVTHQEVGLPVGTPCTAQPGDPTGSHGWNAVTILWMHDTLLGVTWNGRGEGEPGSRLTIAPKTLDLPFVTGRVMTPKGKVFVHWDPQARDMIVEIPDGAEAEVVLPVDAGFEPGSAGESPGGGWRWIERPADGRASAEGPSRLNLSGGGRYRLSL